jgi:putative signal transducing protein
MVTVAECASVDEALFLKSMLEGNGITSYVPDEMMAQNAPHFLFAGTGVRVQVAEEDAENALAIIASE